MSSTEPPFVESALLTVIAIVGGELVFFVSLLCPWDFPGKNTAVGCRFLLQGLFPTTCLFWSGKLL